MCTQFSSRTVYVVPFEPPFIYNNICTSVILTSYIPVYVFVYAIQLFVLIVSFVTFSSIRYRDIPAWLRKGLPGVFWPEHEWTSQDTAPRDLLKSTEIVSFDILNHLAVFATFGMSSPFLGVLMLLSVTLKLFMWRVVIGRFVQSRLPGMWDGAGPPPPR